MKCSLDSDAPGPRETVLNDERHFARITVRLREVVQLASGPHSAGEGILRTE